MEIRDSNKTNLEGKEKPSDSSLEKADVHFPSFFIKG